MRLLVHVLVVLGKVGFINLKLLKVERILPSNKHAHDKAVAPPESLAVKRGGLQARHGQTNNLTDDYTT